jgi:hypothetical protein
VTTAAPLAPPGQREVDVGHSRGAALEIALALFEGALELALQRVGFPPDALARLGIETGKGLQDFGEGTSLAAQELDLELLEPACVGLRDLFETLPQRF